MLMALSLLSISSSETSPLLAVDHHAGLLEDASDRIGESGSSKTSTAFLPWPLDPTAVPTTPSRAMSLAVCHSWTSLTRSKALSLFPWADGAP
jgi:hypothetical protein